MCLRNYKIPQIRSLTGVLHFRVEWAKYITPFRNALEELKPERSFVVTAGADRYPVAKEVEAIGLRDMVFFLGEQ